jgi:hypothetical protein
LRVFLERAHGSEAQVSNNAHSFVISAETSKRTQENGSLWASEVRIMNAVGFQEAGKWPHNNSPTVKERSIQ